jgi:hypothetical protein
VVVRLDGKAFAEADEPQKRVSGVVSGAGEVELR